MSAQASAKLNPYEVALRDSLLDYHLRIKKVSDAARQRQCQLQFLQIMNDGNCLFRSVSDQLTGDTEHHALLRLQVAEWMEQHEGFFGPYVRVKHDGQTLQDYCRKLR